MVKKKSAETIPVSFQRMLKSFVCSVLVSYSVLKKKHGGQQSFEVIIWVQIFFLAAHIIIAKRSPLLFNLTPIFLYD